MELAVYEIATISFASVASAVDIETEGCWLETKQENQRVMHGRLTNKAYAWRSRNNLFKPSCLHRWDLRLVIRNFTRLFGFRPGDTASSVILRGVNNPRSEKHRAVTQGLLNQASAENAATVLQTPPTTTWHSTKNIRRQKTLSTRQPRLLGRRPTLKRAGGWCVYTEHVSESYMSRTCWIRFNIKYLVLPLLALKNYKEGFAEHSVCHVQTSASRVQPTPPRSHQCLLVACLGQSAK